MSASQVSGLEAKNHQFSQAKQQENPPFPHEAGLSPQEISSHRMHIDNLTKTDLAHDPKRFLVDLALNVQFNTLEQRTDK